MLTLPSGGAVSRVVSSSSALSTYDVKLTAVPVLGRAVDEPSAYELVEPATDLNRSEPRETR